MRFVLEERRRRFGVGWGLRKCLEDRGVMKPSKILFELLHNEYTTARLAAEKLPEYKKCMVEEESHGWHVNLMILHPTIYVHILIFLITFYRCFLLDYGTIEMIPFQW